MKLRFKQTTNFEDFLSLKEQWNHLAKSTDIDHAFIRHEWFECWIKHLKPKGQFIILTGWDNDRLVALAPLQIIRQIRKKIPLNILSFMRSSVTPRSNFIVDNTIDPYPFFDSIFSTKGWDVAEFMAMETEKQITNKFINYLKDGKNFVIEEGLQSPYGIIDSDWDSYLKTRSSFFKRRHRASLNRLKKLNSFEIVRIENYEDFEQYFDKMVEISSKSWKSKGKTDLKSDTQMANFYKEFCRITSNENMYLSNVLIIDNYPIAFDFHLKFQNRLVVLRWEYNDDYKYYMPGIVLQNDTIKSILDDGHRLEFDCSGMSTPHKLEIVNNIRMHINVTAGRQSLYGNLIMFLKKKMMKSQDITNNY